MVSNLAGLVWLVAVLLTLLFFQRGLHREIQLVALLLTRRPDVSLVIFSIIFLPGVVLHEISHYLAARLVGVRTGSLSIFPRPLPGGKLQLGYVETTPAGPLRETIIGIAPLVSGVVFVAYAGIARLGLLDLWAQVRTLGLTALSAGLNQMVSQPDFWLWFYLVVTVSSMMLPSASDRRSWLPLGIGVGLLLGIGILLGAGPWLLRNLGPALDRFFQAVAVVFSISLVVHVVLFFPLRLLRLVLVQLTGAVVA